jgi:hypothetical protein
MFNECYLDSFTLREPIVYKNSYRISKFITYIFISINKYNKYIKNMWNLLKYLCLMILKIQNGKIATWK